MRLSIIIPVYNVEQYLAQCLDSVFMQDLTDGEVICVNDGSTDNSREILEEYKQKYPDLVIIDQQNKGLSAARNAGLQVAKGDYVYFLDSDDFLYKDVLNKIYHTAKEKKLDILLCNVLKDDKQSYFDEHLKIDAVLTGAEFCKAFFSQNHYYYPAPVWLYLYRLDFLMQNELRFKEGYLHEDEDFTPRTLLKATRITLENIPLQYHRVKREGAITAVVKPKHLSDSTRICRDLFAFYGQQKQVDSLFYESIYFFYLITIKKAQENNIKREYFYSTEDVRIMGYCAQNNFQKKCAKLSLCSLKIMYGYYVDTLPVIVRRLINRFL